MGFNTWLTIGAVVIFVVAAVPIVLCKPAHLGILKASEALLLREKHGVEGQNIK